MIDAQRRVVAPRIIAVATFDSKAMHSLHSIFQQMRWLTGFLSSDRNRVETVGACFLASLRARTCTSSFFCKKTKQAKNKNRSGLSNTQSTLWDWFNFMHLHWTGFMCQSNHRGFIFIFSNAFLSIKWFHSPISLTNRGCWAESKCLT